MITPVFECSQEGGFVVIRLVLSAICKVTNAVFDIHETQFTFYCSPYYLRLRFDQCLQEGKGERATYDLEANVLTVYLPKANPAEVFTKLDNPAYLIATEKQRASLIQVLSVANSSDDATGVGEELEETEYIQSLPDATAIGSAADRSESLAPAAQCSYGFANAFSGLFQKLDADVVREVVSLRDNPECTTREERRRLRLAAEMTDFDVDALLFAFEDSDGEVAQVLRYVPAHIRDFENALHGNAAGSGEEQASLSVMFASIPELGAGRADPLEEEETTLLPGDDARPVTVWSGNVADFKKPLIEELNPAVDDEREPTASEAAAAAPAASVSFQAAANAAAPPGPRTRLAIPRVCPSLKFTREETEVLMRVKLPRLLFPPSPAEVEALTADLLFSEAYDDLVTEGSGCSESLWNLTQLSPALSYLDPADTLYDACVAFARRALVYPLYRHCALLQRVWAVVGTRLLLGRNYTIRALLRMRIILSHAEHKHLLSTIYLDPLIAYWMHVSEADERLIRMALEIHQHVSRTEPMTVSAASTRGASALQSMLVDAKKVTLYPLTLVHLGLPLSEEEEGRCEG
ncbi:SHQ1 [Leishmania donovani]|uniref:SHQ1 family protein n=1 Tax=Leishmania donovani TaxID=5661 RepID=A0A504XEM2_LEIDO|nr:SHQ1 family protein [Leishmania donovani]CAJ1991939.1 SHQ1 [Leishmania donovani]VDZ47776.1 SHQ1_protein_putative/Pfam:PF04925 [Leishmania donovani]